MRVRLGITLAGLAISCSGAAPPTAPLAPPPTPTTAPVEPPRVDGTARLSAKVEPRSYALSFVVDPAKERFSARTTIDVRLSEPTRWVHLHARDLDIENVRVRAGAQTLAPKLLAGENAGIALEFAEPHRGEMTLEFSHSAALDEVPMSLYRARDDEDWYAFTQFEALAAREAFPCFDEPRFKTPYTIDITVPENLTAVSNAPLESREVEEGQATFRFRTTRPLPTYLVALAVGRFDVVEADSSATDGVPFRILTTHGKSEDTRFALGETPRILQSLVEYFGTPYPFQKLDQLAVPSFRAGAMENAGLVTYRERFLILDAQASASDKLISQSIIAHELAHMWFGNLVTMQWWDDIWLNEAFATWMSNRVLREIAPQAEPGLLAVRDKVGVMERDAFASSTPIRKTIKDDGDIRNAFDPITYRKGQAVLGMLEHWTGEQAFRAGIQRYLSAHQWNNATMFDLFAALEQTTKKPVTEVGRRFVEQAGAPLVEVDWTCEKGRVSVALEQSRYRSSWLAPGPEATWKIPVCARFGTKKSSDAECFLLEESRVERAFEAARCPDYLHPNANEAGYYRWALSPARLSELAGKHLDKLTPAERLALPSHAMALLEAERIDGARYVDLLTSLSHDRHWLTVEAVADGVQSLTRFMRAEDSKGALSHWAKRLLGAHAQRVGLEPKKGEAPHDALLRDPLFEALVAAGADAKTVAQSQAAARGFVEDPKAPVGALALKLEIAARHGDAALHEGLVRALAQTRSPTVREYVVRALGNFRDEALLRRSFQLLLDGTLKAQDYWAVTRGAQSSDATQAVLWAWFLEAEKDLGKLLGERVGAQLPWVLAGFCSESELAEARKHFEPIEPFGPGAKHNLGQALETATRCVQLRKRHSSSIAARLGQLAYR